MGQPAAAVPLSLGPRALAGPILTFGFGTALAVWCAWFVTHLPALGLPEPVSIPLLLAIWLLGMIFAGSSVGAGAGWRVGLGAGLVTAIPGLLVLGSKTEAAAPGVQALKPSLILIAAGFLALGAVLGVVGGTLGGVVRGGKAAPARRDWLFWFSVVAAAAVAPLLFVGGLVTTTNSGMAVPDWPNTFGTNMFLYPLGPRADPGVYLEHSHRLFGSLVGLTTLTLMVSVLLSERRRWLKILAVVAFVLVCVQGILGGVRVLEAQRALAMVHGVLAQLTFGVLVAVSVYLAPSFKARPGRPASCPTCGYNLSGLTSTTCPECGSPVVEVKAATDIPAGKPRQLKFFATGLLHSTILQLIFGAMFRHFRDSHSLWSHIGFSIVVLVMAMLAGFAAASMPGRLGGLGPIVRRCGVAVLVVVSVQFTLGWIAFALGVKNLEAQNTGQMIVRTAHQANGGLMLAAAVVTFLWARRLNRQARAASTAP